LLLYQSFAAFSSPAEFDMSKKLRTSSGMIPCLDTSLQHLIPIQADERHLEADVCH
jgi:hypothetical protein